VITESDIFKLNLYFILPAHRNLRCHILHYMEVITTSYTSIFQDFSSKF